MAESQRATKNQLPALGVDVGGTKIACALISECKIVSQRKEVATQPNRQGNIDSILNFVREFSKQSAISGVGIATCGMISDDGEVVGSAENIAGWNHTPVKHLIEGGTELPVVVENDANASAYGEYRAYNLGSESCVVVVTIGTGVGGGIIVNGKILRGSHFAGGEVGHMKITQGKHRRCSCGLWDCFEAYGAGKGLERTAAELVHERTTTHLSGKQSVDPQSVLGELGNAGSANALTTRAIFDAAKHGDAIALEAIARWHEHLSQGICTVAQVVDPECFILTGGLSKFIDYPLLNRLTNEQAVVGLAGGIQIKPSLLGENPGLIGAAQLLLDKLVGSPLPTLARS